MACFTAAARQPMTKQNACETAASRALHVMFVYFEQKSLLALPLLAVWPFEQTETGCTLGSGCKD